MYTLLHIYAGDVLLQLVTAGMRVTLWSDLPLESGQDRAPLLPDTHLEQMALSTYLRELGKSRVTEEWGVSEQLVAYIWFGGVVGSGAMADVLRGVEHSERQSGQEVTGGEKACKGGGEGRWQEGAEQQTHKHKQSWWQLTGYWSQLEAGALLKEVRDILKLRDVVLPMMCT